MSSKSSRNADITLRQQIKSIIKTIAENQKKWDAAQRRGVSLCTSIENVKSHAIAANEQSSLSTGAQSTLYPNELKSLCEKLRIITTIFEDVLESATASMKQISDAIRLSGSTTFDEQSVLFKTWKYDRFITCLVDIIQCYKNEYEIKLKCMENIAHSKSKEELVLHTCVWEFPTFVTEDVTFQLAQMMFEGDVELESK